MSPSDRSLRVASLLAATIMSAPGATAAGSPPAWDARERRLSTSPKRSEELVFWNARHTVRLSGTLDFPHGAGPFPLAVLIPGTGQQDRNSFVAGDDDRKALSDRLVAAGVATLRLDDRGTGGSTGDVLDTTTSDLAGDVEASLPLLRAHRLVDPRSIGLLGHSEGGWMAAIAASRQADVAFLVLIGTPGVSGADLLERQALVLQPSGASGAASRARLSRILSALQRAGTSRAALDILEAEWSDAARSMDLVPAPPMPSWMRSLASPWAMWFLRFDPRHTFALVRCPVLVLGGTEDTRVPVDPNLSAVASALSGSRRVTTQIIPGLGHRPRFDPRHRSDVMGSTVEPATLAPPEFMANWIRRATKSERR